MGLGSDSITVYFKPNSNHKPCIDIWGVIMTTQVDLGLRHFHANLILNIAKPRIQQNLLSRRSLRRIILQNSSNERLHMIGLLPIKIWACLIKQILHGRLLYHKRFPSFCDATELTIKEFPLGRKVERRRFPELEQLVGKGPKPGDKTEKVVVIFEIGTWDTEEGLSGNKLKDKTAKTPDVKGSIYGSSKNRLGSPKAEWSDKLCRRVCKEICCSG